jgi:hypothetical protein
LYFTGLQFLYAMSSSMIHALEPDAAYVAQEVARRAAAERNLRGSHTVGARVRRVG